jgi:hypothetical protein
MLTDKIIGLPNLIGLGLLAGVFAFGFPKLIRDILKPTEPSKLGLNYLVYKLVTCPFCLGFWLGVLCFYLLVNNSEIIPLLSILGILVGTSCLTACSIKKLLDNSDIIIESSE